MATTPLGEHQRKHLLHAFLQIHRRLAELEARMAEAARPSAFSNLVNDLSPTEARVVQDHFARIRSAMLARLQELGIPLEIRKLSLRWACMSTLMHIQVSIDDLGPKSFTAYGPLDEAGARVASAIRQDLERLTERVQGYLKQGLGRDLGQRLERLAAASDEGALLALLERVISRWQLVEFRPALDLIAGRLEDPRFEIALFGRVSSGKSSLLNHIAGIDALPVGVTPVTAVPTRLTHGETPSVQVSFAESAPRTIRVEQLGEYASEEGNPGNRKHVTGLLVRLPSPRLRDGVVFVDTPGVGSLAMEGGAESMAYLPRCDLGVVLIDAAGTLDQEDLALLRALYESGSPAMLLLSKADLLAPADRQRMIGYIREQVRRALGIDLPVHPVSTVGAEESLLIDWFERAVGPLLARHQELARESLRRKAAHLRDSVAATLELRLGQAGPGRERDHAIDAAAARRLLDEADAALREIQRRWRDWPLDRAALGRSIPGEAARLALEDRRAHGNGQRDDPVVRATRAALTRRERSAQELVSGLSDVLGRTLDGLRRAAAPLVMGDPAEARDARPTALPTADLAALREPVPRTGPWWSRLAPALAARWLADRIEDQLGPAIREAVEFHDRRLHAWIQAEIERLVAHYEALADPVREHVRNPAARPGDQDDLEREQQEADLRALRERGAPRAVPAAPAPAPA